MDTLTLNAVDMPSMESVEQLEYVPFDPIFKRTEGTVREKGSQKPFKTTKGAPHVILKLVSEDNFDLKVIEKVEADVHALGLRGIRALAVAKTNDEDKWEMLLLLTPG